MSSNHASVAYFEERYSSGPPCIRTVFVYLESDLYQSWKLACYNKNICYMNFLVFAAVHQSVKSAIHFWSESSMGWESSAGAGLLAFALRSAPVPDCRFLAGILIVAIDRAQKAFHCVQAHCSKQIAALQIGHSKGKV